MDKATLHVVPHTEGWAVKREGNERASSTHSTQKDAIDSARKIAKEGDDIVVHRPDGTIRDRTTYTGSNGGNGGSSRDDEPTLSDLKSVGTRVSWGAVLAGGVVALVVYLTLTMLALAIGISTIDHLSSRTFVIGAAFVTAFSLLAALFIGGYVASQTTAGENHKEALIYGVLVWGTMFVMAMLIGGTVSTGFGSIAGAVNKTGDNHATISAADLQAKLNLTDEQRQQYQAALGTPPDAATVAWWSFATLALSLLAAMAGAWVGCGPEIVIKRLFIWRRPQQIPVQTQTTV